MMIKRDVLEPERYQYLNIEDSKLYESVKDSLDQKDVLVKKLLEQKSAVSRARHANSNY